MAADPDPFLLPREHLAEGLPPPSADFVERTLRLVMQDRAEIAAEAARVDEVMIDRDVLSAFALPPIRPDFVASTWHAVLLDRRSQGLGGQPGTGPTSTLRPLLTGAHGQAPVWFRRAGILAAAAIVLLSLVLLLMPRQDRQPQQDATTIALSAESFTPVPWATALARHVDHEDFALMPDPLIMLAGGGR